GVQDVQKTMGVIFLTLLTVDWVDPGDDIPVWVVVGSALVISLGTLSGGWRVIRTLGHGIAKLDPPRGFAAESVAAAVMLTPAHEFGAPISTTHTITAAVTGAGASRRFSAVRWNVTGRIAVGWVLTIPAAGLVAALSYWALNPLLA